MQLKEMANASVDLVTCCQAIHWFDDIPAFYAEVRVQFIMFHVDASLIPGRFATWERALVALHLTYREVAAAGDQTQGPTAICKKYSTRANIQVAASSRIMITKS